MINPREDLIVMYHYVWPDEIEIVGGVRPMLVTKFEEQLDYLLARYKVVGANEFLTNSARNCAEDDRTRCLLTFDDATRDHAEIVTPILLRRGLSGVFFAIQNPSEGIMPLTHAAHWLLSDDDERVWRFFVDEIGMQKLGEEREALRIYHYEPAIRARIKYAINFALDEDSVRRVLSILARERGIQIDQLARDWFASPDQLRWMHENGMTIGVHARTHRSLKAIGGEAMAREIESCGDWLTNLLGERPRWFACPFGGVGAAREDVELMRSALVERGFDAAVGTHSSSVPKHADRLDLPRVDCVALARR